MTDQAKQPNIDLNSLKLREYAEFDRWDDFIAAIDEFQKKTFIKLTVITSKKLKTPEETGKKKRSNAVTTPKRKDLKLRFGYQYLKMVCKHYGRYVSTSKGIRPNQQTAKLGCPTFMYASYDLRKDKFIVRHLKINCNHELRDENVVLAKLLQKPVKQTKARLGNFFKYV